MNTDPRFKAGTVNGEKRENRRHRPVNAEGCKPETDTQLLGLPCTGAAARRNLKKAEGFKPDLNTLVHPGDIAAITEQPREFVKLTSGGWEDSVRRELGGRA